MCENLDVDLEAIACVHSLQYSYSTVITYIGHVRRCTVGTDIAVPTLGTRTMP